MTLLFVHLFFIAANKGIAANLRIRSGFGNAQFDNFMGIHLIPYILKGRVTDDYGSPYFEVEELEGFDGVRYSGDKDFVLAEELEFLRLEDDPSATSFSGRGRDYFRPKDIGKAEKWVKNNIVEINQPRLLWLLGEMRKNDKLFLYCSW